MPSAPDRSLFDRLTSLDAYRGFVMLLMMAEVLQLSKVAVALPDSAFWSFLAWHQSHVEWLGCTLHDLIQPSFSFIVGVALPFSLAARRQRGDSQSHLVLHAFGRAAILIFLGIFLRSVGKAQTNFTFDDTLTQIGLGYGFLFLLGFRSLRTQLTTFAVLLVGYWAAFAVYPAAVADFDYAKVGVKESWLAEHRLSGFAAHWNKNSNLAWAFDTYWMNLFPREKPFEFSGGGYATLSFIPTLATMILGLVAGVTLRSERTAQQKINWLVVAGILCYVTGCGLGALGICPVVKRIWTPSWVLYSGGWCMLLMAGFYVVLDVWKLRGWAFPMVVVGLNSIAAYCIAHLFDHFIASALKTHLGQDTFAIFGTAYEPLLHGASTLSVMWLILFWMYRRKLFLRI
jgi:heparan-alpha-glucosaminide N-acetyltransferase